MELDVNQNSNPYAKYHIFGCGLSTEHIYRIEIDRLRFIERIHSGKKLLIECRNYRCRKLNTVKSMNEMKDVNVSLRFVFSIRKQMGLIISYT